MLFTLKNIHLTLINGHVLKSCLKQPKKNWISILLQARWSSDLFLLGQSAEILTSKLEAYLLFKLLK